MQLFHAIIKKFKPAIAGVVTGLKDKSILIQSSIGIFVILYSILLKFNIIEMIYVITMIGLVITIEYLNTVIEKIVNKLSPEYSTFAKEVKDLSAAAVLIISIISAIGYFMILWNRG